MAKKRQKIIQDWQLIQRQSLSLNAKVHMSKDRIKQWYNHWNGLVYVAFSGGKDSTVLLHLVRSIYPDVPAVFCNTGLEYPEIIRFVRSVDNVVWLKPHKTFKKVLEEHGYPVISKDVSKKIQTLRNNKNNETAYNLHIKGIKRDGTKAASINVLKEQYRYLIDAPFKISAYCCQIMKKAPFNKYAKQTGRKPYIGILAQESRQRTLTYLQYGCNTYDAEHPTSWPLAFWTEDDIWEYIHKNNVEYCKIYDGQNITRTGCVYCMFGVHLENYPNRFQQLKKTHPRFHKYCMEKLGLKDVLDFIGVPYE